MIQDLFGLQGRTAVVTGAAGQLGGNYVRALMEAGANVVALDIDPENPKGRLQEIDSGQLLVLQADITRKDSLQEALDKALEKFGGLSVLVNNAAIDAPPGSGREVTGLFENYPEESWDRMMEVNLKGMFLCCQVFGGHMAANAGGTIINISSIYGILSPDQRIYEYRESPFFKPAAYSVSKSGVLNLTRWLATYWAKRNMRVNTLTLAGVFNSQDKEFLRNYSQKIPLGRMAAENEFNGALLFLASAASSYMTGANLVVDGGFSAW